MTDSDSTPFEEWLRDRQRNDWHLYNLGINSILVAARDSGIPLSWRDGIRLMERMNHRRGAPALAEFVVDFLRLYLSHRKVELLADPCVTTPVLLPAILDLGIADRAEGYVLSEEVAGAADVLLPAGTAVTWHDGWRAPSTSDRFGKPDLILSMPPVGTKRRQAQVSGLSGERLKVNDDEANLTVLNATDLAPGGEAIFLVLETFAGRRKGQVREVLEQLGLYVHAAIQVRGGMPAISAPMMLIFVRKEPPESTFVAQLTAQVDRSTLVKNLNKRRPGKVPELGRLVEWSEFRSFDVTLATERVEQMARRAKLPMVPLGDLLAEPVRQPPAKGGQPLEPSLNTVYLPTFVTAIAHADVDETNGKARAYFKLVFDPQRASAEYVATMLNSDFGRALRRTWSSGTYMPSIRLSALLRAALPLPSLAEQQDFIKARTQLQNIRAELADIERELTSQPANGRHVSIRLKAFQPDPLGSWLDVLPFPLASILWRYSADADAAAKVNHLLRFFEATAEWFVTVLLSAFSSDAGLLEGEKKNWQLDDNAGVLRRATFGSWTKLGFAMAASARRLLAAGDEQDPVRLRMRSAFGVSSQAFIDAVTSKQAWKVLDDAREERNLDAHGGITSQREREQKLVRLEALLADLRTLTSAATAEVWLVRPGAGSFRQGVGRYEHAELLIGPNASFRQQPLETLMVLEDELHLVDASEEPLGRALLLLPFVVMRPAPETEQNTCYFYNSLTNGAAQFVSYHFPNEGSIREPEPALSQLFARLEAPPPEGRS